MTEPRQGVPQVPDGTDVRADPDNLEVEQPPATSDPDAFTEDEALGGVGGGSPGGGG